LRRLHRRRHHQHLLRGQRSGRPQHPRQVQQGHRGRGRHRLPAAALRAHRRQPVGRPRHHHAHAARRGPGGLRAMSRLRLRARRRRSWGQSLVEMSLIAPALVALAAGCGPVGVIAYGAASVETSARAAARVAAEYPNRSLDFVATLGTRTYTCGQAPTDAQTENSVCAAARSSAGLLSGSALGITITSSSTISLAAPGDVERTGNTCPGGALETGTVSNLPAGTVATISSPSKASVGTVLSNSLGSFSICLSAPNNSQGTQSTSITATAVDGTGCTYNTSVGVSVAPSKSVTPSPANMTLPSTGVCPTPPP